MELKITIKMMLMAPVNDALDAAGAAIEDVVAVGVAEGGDVAVVDVVDAEVAEGEIADEAKQYET